MIKYKRSNTLSQFTFYSSIKWLVLFFSDVRNQLNEQLKCLESRLEVQVAMVTELQDFFRRLSEVEMEYSKSLEKLVKNTKLKHRQEKQK